MATRHMRSSSFSYSQGGAPRAPKNVGDLVTYKPPIWASHLKDPPKYRLPLARLPTPLLPLNLVVEDGDIVSKNIYIKRDDLTEFLGSGNKIRKLEFLLGDAVSKGCDCIITIGGSQSNHCRATAVMATQAGLDSYLILRKDPPLDELPPEGNVLINRLMGAIIRTVSAEQYKEHGPEKLLALLESELIKEGRRPYVITMGGSNSVGIWGYIEAFREIEEQVRGYGFDVDDIVIACGSGGSAAGLALGAKLSGLPLRVSAVSVCDDAAFFHSQINNIFKKMGSPLRSEQILNIIDDYRGIGYGLNTEDELAFAIDVARSSGILLDPSYTLKAMRAVINSPQFKNRKVLFIHTGGSFGWFTAARGQELEEADLLPQDEINPLIGPDTKLPLTVSGSSLNRFLAVTPNK
eukprot:TRINITY_DN579_c0_g2_i12.p1 TRINITY_DN579_c0_g2~~TRINITY_DN579_c0_g2_i12.p1  ORF type:complete len:407 (-),score=99.50 TRINITY_DN579_c0_g2_i12:1402-2622(-)